MTASISRVLPSLKCAVLPSNFVTSGSSSIPSGHLNPIAPERYVQVTDAAPYFRFCSAMSSAE